MTEKLLQYIWQFQCYNTNSLTTADGESLQIIYPGQHNTNQGPDFLNAKICVNSTTWAGNIELHVKSTEWLSHKHSEDKNYNNVILHVVWQDDMRLDLPFPVLELQSKVSKLLLSKYDELMLAGTFISCEKNIHQVENLIWIAWKERLLVERLQNKAAAINAYLTCNKNNWEETFWWILARNFGIKVNAVLFEKIAQSLPLSIISKHKSQIHQLEALLFGQAGLLEKKLQEAYPVMLQKEYRYLKKLYALQQLTIQPHFLRMRPANFPTIRLAQLAMLLHQSHHFFSKMKEAVSVTELRLLLDITANDYWHYHFVFDEESGYKEKHLGNQMISNLIINAVVPTVFAYGLHNDEQVYKDKAISWLQELAPEKNNVTAGFELLQIKNGSAFDSQALIQLKNEYCILKRCLECAIGNKLIKK